MSRVAIVILNWNGRRHLEQFLGGVVAHSELPGGSVEVVLADNGSSDGSVSWVRRQHPGVRVVALGHNHGFAQGYNLALRQVEAPYYVLLNSDVGTPPGWLAPLVGFMEANPLAAACMPKIRSQANPTRFEYAGAAGGFIDALGFPFCRGRILGAIEEDRGQYDRAVPVFWASGACLLIRAAAYWEAGGLDPRFFAHMEEIDLCWRLQRMGLSIWCVPQAHVFHVGGGTLPNQSPRKLLLNHRNNLLMLYKNLSPARLPLVLALRMGLALAVALGYLVSFQFRSLAAVAQAHAQLLARLPQAHSQRKALAQRYPYAVRHIAPLSILYEYFVRGRRTYARLHLKE